MYNSFMFSHIKMMPAMVKMMVMLMTMMVVMTMVVVRTTCCSWERVCELQDPP